MEEREAGGNAETPSTQAAGCQNPIRDMVADMKRALDAGAYRSAMALALTIPDICSKAERVSGTKEYPSYARWFDKNVAWAYRVKWRDGSSESTPTPAPKEYEFPVFDGMACYALRCSFLHSWSFQMERSPIDEFEVRIRRKPSDPLPVDQFAIRGNPEDGGDLVRSCTIDLIGLCDVLAKCALECFGRSKAKSEYSRFLPKFV